MSSAGPDKYCAIPGLESARVFIPINSKSSCRTNLETYAPTSYKGRVFKSFLLILPRFIFDIYLNRVFLPEDKNKKLNEISGLISKEFDIDTVSLSFYQGTKGPREKQTVQVSKGNTVKAYIKVAETVEAKKLVENEISAYEDLDKLQLGSVEIPEDIRCAESGSYLFLYQKSPDKKAGFNGLTQDEIISYVYEASQYKNSKKSTHEFIAVETNKYWTAEERNLGDKLAGWLVDDLKMDSIITHFCHGDFVAWNVLRLKNGRPYVFDWEYSSDSLPALFDVLHYLIMPLALVEKDEPLSIVSNILDRKTKNGSFVAETAEISGIKSKEIPGYLAVYLWSMILRGVVVDESNNARYQTELSKNPVFRSMLNYLLLTKSHNKRKNILVSAYACEPERGSEPGVGWNMVKAISQKHTAWVVTRISNKNDIELFLSDKPLDNVYFIYVDPPKWLTFWKRGGRGIRTYYYLWQFSALIKILKQRKYLNIDIAHHVTFVNDWLFTFLALLPYPYVWGPIGSHPKIPEKLTLDKKQHYKDVMRCAFQSFMRHMDILFWLSMYRANLIVGISEDVFQRTPLKWVKPERRSLQTAIGIEPDLISELTGEKEEKKTNDVLDVVSVGRLIPIKGFHLAVEALARYVDNGGKAHLEIIGRGSEKPALKRLIEELNMQNHITLTDWMERKDVILRLKKADVFLYPSFESGGIVILEAMLLGLPVITTNVGGPGSIVNDNVGFKAMSDARDLFINELLDYLTILGSNDASSERMVTHARETVMNIYAWDKRYKTIDEWYDLIK